MAISYGALSSSAGTGFTSVPWRAPGVANDGDLLLWWCVNKYPAAIPGTPTGHTLITRVTGGSGAEGVDVGEVLGSWYSKISDGTEAGTTETVSISGGNCAVSRALSFSRSAGSGWDVAFANASQATNENSWPLVTGDLDIAAGDMLVIGVSKNADNDLTHNYTVTATGVTFGEVVNTPTFPSGTTNGDDCAYHLAHVPVLTGSSTGPVSVTVAASGSAGNSAGAISVLRLREAGAGPAPVEFDGTVADATGVQNTALSIPLSSYFEGGLTPFAYSLASGTLPSGVTVDPDTGEVTGTPTVSGTFGSIVVKATDTEDNEAFTNAFAVRLEANPTSDVGYYAIASTGNANYEHTTASHSFHHDGSWWTFLRSGANWNLYEESGNTPAAAGETVDWVGTPHLASVHVSQLCTVVVDTPRNKAYVLGFSDTAVTAVLVVLTYSSGAWSVTQTVNVAGSSGVGLGSSSTFSNHEKLSLGVDPDGVPYVFAGNKGAGTGATYGCHLAWPDNAAELGGTWSYHTIDSSSVTTGDASGRFTGVISQGGTDYIVVCYTEDGATKTKLAYHQVETVRSNYTSGWTILDLETTLSVDNHVWAGVMNHGGETVVVTAIKNGDGAGAGQIHLFTSLLGPGMTWTHKRHQVTNGVAELGALQETPSRPSCVLDNSNGEVWIFFHARDSYPYKWVGYKKASLSTLLAAAGPNDVFDISLSRNSEVAIYDASLNAVWNAKTPAHPVTSAMGYFPVTAAVAASGTTGDSVWYTAFNIAGVPSEVAWGVVPPISLLSVMGAHTVSASTNGSVAALSLSAPAGTAATSTSASATLAPLSLTATAAHSSVVVTAGGQVRGVSILAPEAAASSYSVSSGSIKLVSTKTAESTATVLVLAGGSLKAVGVAAPQGYSVTADLVTVSGGVKSVSAIPPAASAFATVSASGQAASAGVEAPTAVQTVKTYGYGEIDNLKLISPTGHSTVQGFEFAAGNIRSVSVIPPAARASIRASSVGSIRRVSTTPIYGHSRVLVEGYGNFKPISVSKITMSVGKVMLASGSTASISLSNVLGSSRARTYAHGGLSSIDIVAPSASGLPRVPDVYTTLTAISVPNSSDSAILVLSQSSRQYF